ncbi:xylosyltransferase 1 [Phtheirospermum japonicum]|uniref:Xylosyltransferase 1 n=1 Tax=Phtheirospermum japonicum TaxID=374723 RepID=A0A830BB01_9LAMI|nr:xylosyltransferase 1 [Phtheirospermum japonicum]
MILMGLSKIFPNMNIPSCRIYLLSFSLVLMFLVLWAHLPGISNFNSNNKYEHIIPIRRTLSKGADGPPVLAYWILGSKGETKRMLRLLKAIYHPRNQYLLQLDSSSSEYERVELAISAQSERVFADFGNVDVVGKSYGVNRMGPSGLGAMLHAAALLLRVSGDWDWFIPLSASDYPLLSQDDILYAFTSLPKDVNFMGYTNDTAREKRQNVSQIVVDPSLYLREKTPIFYAAETREKPDAFEIFGGSPWMILTRSFLEHCVNGWDNFPRKLLMYFSNVAFPLESYFQTILCNTPEFQNTTVVNDDLRYKIIQNQTVKEAINMSRQAIFARPFNENDPELQEIDEHLLNRDPDRVVPGKWGSRD